MKQVKIKIKMPNSSKEKIIRASKVIGKIALISGLTATAFKLGEKCDHACASAGLDYLFKKDPTLEDHMRTSMLKAGMIKK